MRRSMLVLVALAAAGTSAAAFVSSRTGEQPAARAVPRPALHVPPFSIPNAVKEVAGSKSQPHLLTADGRFAKAEDLENHPGYNPSGTRLTSADADRLDSLVASYNDELKFLEERIGAIERELTDLAIADGRAEVYDGKNMPSTTPEFPVVSGKHIAGVGTFIVRIDPRQHPDLQELVTRHRKARRDGRAAIRSFFVERAEEAKEGKEGLR